MAYVLVGPSGKSNAKVGDKVVTGGGIYEKLADGTSKLIAKLSTPTGTTKNYADVVSEFNRLSGSSTTTRDPVQREPYEPEDYTVKSVDDNGIISLAGYDPGDYNTAYKTTSSTNISTVMGYVVLGLVGVALLDRFMNGGGKRASA